MPQAHTEQHQPVKSPPSIQIKRLSTDPEGFDAIELKRLLKDSGLGVMRLEELSWGADSDGAYVDSKTPGFKPLRLFGGLSS